MTQEDTIKLYWLPYTRAQRIVWLLEELDLNYELIKHKRVHVHPLGKAPLLEIMKPNGEKITLAESGWIVQYLIENYDKNNKFKPETLQDANQIGYFLHYSEGTIQPMLVGLLVNHFAVTTAPSQSKELVKQMIGQINRGYYGTELLKNLKYLNNIVIEQKNRGSDFIVGNKLSAADIMLSFPILGAFTRDQMSDNYTNLKNDYPDLYKYFLNLTKLDGWKKAAGKVKDMEKVIIDGKL